MGQAESGVGPCAPVDTAIDCHSSASLCISFDSGFERSSASRAGCQVSHVHTDWAWVCLTNLSLLLFTWFIRHFMGSCRGASLRGCVGRVWLTDPHGGFDDRVVQVCLTLKIPAQSTSYHPKNQLIPLINNIANTHSWLHDSYHTFHTFLRYAFIRFSFFFCFLFGFVSSHRWLP